MNKPDSLQNMINVMIRIDNRQYKRYVDKKTNVKTHSIKRFFKKDLIKLNIIKTKKLRIKVYYFCGKKDHLKRNYSKKVIKVMKKWIETFEKENVANDYVRFLWITCYDDEYRIYESSKNLSSWYLK